MSVLQTQSSQLNVFTFKFTRPLRGRPIVADLYPQLGQKNFCDFLEGDSGGHSYSQDTSVESFWS